MRSTTLLCLILCAAISQAKATLEIQTGKIRVSETNNDSATTKQEEVAGDERELNEEEEDEAARLKRLSQALSQAKRQAITEDQTSGDFERFIQKHDEERQRLEEEEERKRLAGDEEEEEQRIEGAKRKPTLPPKAEVLTPVVTTDTPRFKGPPSNAAIAEETEPMEEGSDDTTTAVLLYIIGAGCACAVVVVLRTRRMKECDGEDDSVVSHQTQEGTYLYLEANASRGSDDTATIRPSDSCFGRLRILKEKMRDVKT